MCAYLFPLRQKHYTPAFKAFSHAYLYNSALCDWLSFRPILIILKLHYRYDIFNELMGGWGLESAKWSQTPGLQGRNLLHQVG